MDAKQQPPPPRALQLATGGEEEEDEWDRDFVVIHQHPRDPRHDLEFELEEAMADGQRYIIIQNKVLGSETEFAITVGNFFHKSAVLSGVVCMVSGLLGTLVVALPAGFVSSLCALIYDVSWAYDGCCKYQVVRADRYFEELPMALEADPQKYANHTILVRKDDRVRRRLHNIVAGCSAVYCGVKLYRWSRT
eukprot:comp24782_c0_seq1/m.46880 comp24782_c0_seq1/g.46880  ORF comp24782_c0_seq1/g.46880 comp24782_c0_seq1/m.46880 type:complete len:192 (-) comp24782_c0_seq1:11-586(-)